MLAGPLRDRLAALNPGLPGEAYDDAVRSTAATAASQTIVAANREKYDLLRDGVQVTYRDDRGRPIKRRLRVLGPCSGWRWTTRSSGLNASTSAGQAASLRPCYA